MGGNEQEVEADVEDGHDAEHGEPAARTRPTPQSSPLHNDINVMTGNARSMIRSGPAVHVYAASAPDDGGPEHDAEHADRVRGQDGESQHAREKPELMRSESPAPCSRGDCGRDHAPDGLDRGGQAGDDRKRHGVVRGTRRPTSSAPRRTPTGAARRA